MSTHLDLSAANDAELPHCAYQITCGAACLRVHTRTPAIVITMVGDIDMTNDRQVACALRRFAQLRTSVVVDLSQLSFINAAGFRILLKFAAAQQHSGFHCCVVSGPASRSLCRILTTGDIVEASSVSAALQRVATDIAARRRLSTETLVRQHEPRHGGPAAVVAR